MNNKEIRDYSIDRIAGAPRSFIDFYKMQVVHENTHVVENFT